jgi:type I restriction enzyme, S subunit
MKHGETLKEIANFNPSRRISRGTLAPFVDMAALPTNGRNINTIGQREYQGGGSKFKNGDTLFARITPCLENGKTAKMSGIKFDETAHGSTEFIVISAKQPKYDEEFIYYLARLPEFRLYAEKRMEGTSGRQRVSWQSIATFPLQLPDKHTRAKIANILSSLDNKIELNQRMNETLEAMARALFKSWFIDFDPVRTKVKGRKPKGMDATTAALFPAAFNDDGVPKQWGKVPFSGLIEIIGGGTPKTSIAEYWNGTIPWFSVVDAPNETDIYVVDTEKKVTQAGVDNSSTKILPIGTTIISARGTVGRVALTGVPMTINQSCYAIRGKNGLPDYFTYFCVRQLVTELKARTHGSVFDTITRDTFDTVSFVKPDKKIAMAFDKTVLPLMQKVLNNLHESRSLSALRDALLPKLISGEVRIDHAKRKRGK